MQIAIFCKAIDPLWKQYDPSDSGEISQEQFNELGKMALEKAGYGQYFNQEAFEKACQAVAKTDGEEHDGKARITKR